MSRARATALLADLRQRGVEVVSHNGKLRFHPASAVSSAVAAQMCALKHEILEDLAESLGEPAARRGYVPGIRPTRPCYCCGSREFYRGSSGPEWVCILCHGPWNPDWIAERFVLGATAALTDVARGSS